jgi:ribonuclease HI
VYVTSETQLNFAVAELFLLLLHALRTFALAQPKRTVLAFSLEIMVRPSRISRVAQRAHKREQENLGKQGLPRCKGCHLCSLADAREIKKASRGSDAPFTQQHKYKQCSRSAIRKNLRNILFKGAIITLPRHVAHTEAMSEVEFEQGHLVFWTDGSRFDDDHCGIGVAYRSSTEAWTKLSWSAPRSIKPHVLEIYAISKALEIAWERCRDMGTEQRPSSVCIYSDCSGALEYFSRFRQTLTRLKELPYGEELVGPGIIAAERLSSIKVAIKLQYVPGHSSIQGNTYAHRAARDGAKSTKKRRPGRIMTAVGAKGIRY